MSKKSDSTISQKKRRTKRMHSPEFKRQACARAEALGSVSQAARELDLSPSLLRKWLESGAADTASTNGAAKKQGGLRRKITPSEHYKFAAAMAVQHGEVKQLLSYIYQAVHAEQARITAATVAVAPLESLLKVKDHLPSAPRPKSIKAVKLRTAKALREAREGGAAAAES